MRETKTTLIKGVSESIQWTQVKCEVVINSFIDLLTKNLIEGKEIEIRGLGIFQIKETKERVRTNPINRERMVTPSKTYIKFKVSQKITEGLNATKQI